MHDDEAKVAGKLEKLLTDAEEVRRGLRLQRDTRPEPGVDGKVGPPKAGVEPGLLIEAAVLCGQGRLELAPDRRGRDEAGEQARGDPIGEQRGRAAHVEPAL